MTYTNPDVVSEFRGTYVFLSNFYSQSIRVPSLDAPASTAEHAYQALKTLDRGQRSWILDSPTPGVAKRRGRGVILRPDWNTVRADVMRDVLEAKFADPVLAARLAATGDAQLVEGNHWHDQFWGSCLCPRHEAVPGKNMLGELLMRIRAGLK